SERNRNVRIFAAIRMSAESSLACHPLVRRPPPRVIFAWTFLRLGGILSAAVGRIGLRRSATRAPAGRLYARGPGRRWRLPVPFSRGGVGRQCAKLRGFGGGTPNRCPRRHLLVFQVVPLEADRHAPIQAQLDHHPAATLARVDRLEQLVEAILK